MCVEANRGESLVVCDLLLVVAAAGVREDGIHAATVTIAGAVKPGTDFDPDNIAELFWTAHTDWKDAWQTEYRFTGA